MQHIRLLRAALRVQSDKVNNIFLGRRYNTELPLQCTLWSLCSIFFHTTEQAHPYLKFKEYYPIEHVFIPACSSALKYNCLSFSDFQTLDP